MTAPVVFQITQGVMALSVVDKAASGYLDAWQAPGGKTAATAALADYTPAAQAFTCQITEGKLTPSKQSSTVDVPATLCAPAQSIPQPGATLFSLDLSFLQDATVRDGISSFLYQNDTLEAYFLLALNAGVAAPRAVGRCNLHAAGFGGAPRANLIDQVSFDVKYRPDILFGSGSTTRLIAGRTGVVTNSP